LIRGTGQTSGSILVVDAIAGTDSDAVHRWVGGSSGAIFLPDTKPYLPPNFFIYIDRGGSSTPFVLRQTDQNYQFTGTHFDLGRKNPASNATMKALTCVNSAFSIPTWCRSWSMKNISGADMYYRRYSPNILANVIDVAPSTLLDDTVVGMQLDDAATVSFESGSFTPGASYAIAASAAATDGCIVNFNP
jgi:hypothetical protein